MRVLALFAVLAVIAVSAQDDCTPLRCQRPLNAGTCTDSIPQFYFDDASQQCKPFNYSGCGGNVNRFRTLQLCENTCIRPCSSTTAAPTKTTTKRTTTAKPLPYRCTLQLDPGTCTSAIPRFYYDAATGQCTSFDYSGCGGNVNNFRSQELCEEICLA